MTYEVYNKPNLKDVLIKKTYKTYKNAYKHLYKMSLYYFAKPEFKNFCLVIRDDLNRIICNSNMEKYKKFTIYECDNIGLKGKMRDFYL